MKVKIITGLCIVILSAVSGFGGAVLYNHYFLQPDIRESLEAVHNSMNKELVKEGIAPTPSVTEPVKKQSETSPTKKRNDATCRALRMEYSSNKMQAEMARKNARQGGVSQSQFGYETSMANARRAMARMINLGCQLPEY